MLVHWCSYWVYSLGVFGCLAQDPKTTEKTDRVRPIGFDSEYGSIHPGWPRNCRDVSLQVHPCGKKKLMKKRPADSWRFRRPGVFSAQRDRWKAEGPTFPVDARFACSRSCGSAQKSGERRWRTSGFRRVGLGMMDCLMTYCFVYA